MPEVVARWRSRHHLWQSRAKAPQRLALSPIPKRTYVMELSEVLAGVRGRKVPALARAITLVESAVPGFEELLSALHAQTGRARRIGITGPPGAGKSTLTEQLVQAYRTADLTVGVVAVDPTSPYTGGALLGDRIRMESVSLDPGVYIRSMASRGSVGGLATSTSEVCDVLDAFGFDRILIETVGVGQSGLDIAGLADSTVVVLVPESGDGIQALKAGIMEIADLFVINKSDRPGAARLQQEIEVALAIRRGKVYRHVPAHHGVDHGRTTATHADATPARPDDAWQAEVLSTVATDGSGVAEVVSALDQHHAWLERSGNISAVRRGRLEQRTRDVVERGLRQWMWAEAGIDQFVRERLDGVEAGQISPYDVAHDLIAQLRTGASR